MNLGASFAAWCSVVALVLLVAGAVAVVGALLWLDRRASTRMWIDRGQVVDRRT